MIRSKASRTIEPVHERLVSQAELATATSKGTGQPVDGVPQEIPRGTGDQAARLSP
jgi:hypothetical protein